MESVAEKITAKNTETMKLQMRPYVISSKYSSPESLPLFFYVGYQLRDKYDHDHKQVLLFCFQNKIPPLSLSHL